MAAQLKRHQPHRVLQRRSASTAPISDSSAALFAAITQAAMPPTSSSLSTAFTSSASASRETMPAQALERIEAPEVGHQALAGHHPAAQQHGRGQGRGQREAQRGRQGRQHAGGRGQGLVGHARGIEGGGAVYAQGLREGRGEALLQAAGREPETGHARREQGEGDQLARAGNVAFLARLLQAPR